MTQFGAVRNGDNHICSVPLSGAPGVHVGGIIQAQGNSKVFINKMPAVVKDDTCICPEGGPNKVAIGSSSVFFGNKAAARINDTTTHGAGQIASGSSNVFIGG
jgi:uncharacterized Zn-binding protein involved in type VI secretion